MNLVPGERGVIGSPWGSPWIEMVLKWGLSLKNHVLSAGSFISASPVQALGSHIIITTTMIGRMIALVSASEEVRLHVLSTPGGRIYFVKFHLSMRTGQSHFLLLAGNSIQQIFIALLSTYYVRGCPPC